MEKQRDRQGNLISAGILLGIGGAGFFDGIVLHEILQWHQMLTSVRPIANVSDMEANMFWDGVFHAVMYAIVATGIVFLWRAASDRSEYLSLKTFVGSLLLGAGLFNVIEGSIDHQILGIHHVKPGPNQLVWDMGFLAISAGIAIIGWILLRSTQQEVTTVGKN